MGFAYNPASQMVEQSLSNGHFVHQGETGWMGNYSVNGLNQYTGIEGQTINYDDNGNLESEGARAYSYDVENRLNQVMGAHNASLYYDPMGRLYKIHSSDTGVSTYFLYSGDSLIAEHQNGQMTKRYVHGGGRLAPLIRYDGSAIGTSNRRFLHTNHQGSVIAQSDNSGAVTNINTYDEYGVPGAGNIGRFSYTGQMHLPEIGLYHYRARMYDPAMGRFMQTDPIGYEDQMNLYAYVHNDPLNFIDPTGEESYLVSRPLDLPVPANHNFVVTNADYLGDPNATIYSYGNTGDGRMGRVDETTTGFSEGTHETDRSAWQDLSNEGSSITYRQIDAPDSRVDSLAKGMVQGQKYSIWPAAGRSAANSNSAAGAIARAADGGAPEVDNGRAQPGSGQAGRVPIMHNFLRKEDRR